MDAQAVACRRRQQAAERYRPGSVRLLLVAEAPPSDLERYFYFEDVREQDSLFRYVVQAVFDEPPSRAAKAAELGRLREAGVFLIDLKTDQRGRQQLSAGEVCAALISSRLCSPSPLYDVAGWASGTALHELMGIPPALLNDDRLGRGLETLAVYAESLRGALAARAIERFGIDAGRLHVDLTTLRVAVALREGLDVHVPHYEQARDELVQRLRRGRVAPVRHGPPPGHHQLVVQRVDLADDAGQLVAEHRGA